MIEQLEIQQAIAVLEQYKESLSPPVLELSLSVLQDKLTHLSDQPEEQRYALTVLQADLSGFTAMAEHLDPEEVRDTIHAVWQTLDGVIERWGGTVDKHIGDSVVAFFGLPAPAPDDATRAIHAAIDMQVALLRFNQQMQTAENGPQRHRLPPFEMRIGLSSGSVLLGTLGGNGENTAVGEALQEAALLEKNAPVGSILIAQQLSDAVRHQFDLKSQNAVRLPTSSRSLRVYTVERLRPPAFWLAPAPIVGEASRMVGRDNELVILQETLDIAIISRSAQVITVIGEAGLGKTRLLVAFEQWLEMFGDNPIMLKGQANLGADKRPFALFRNLVESTFGLRDNPPRPLLQLIITRLIRQVDPAFPEPDLFASRLIAFLYEDKAEDQQEGLSAILDWLRLLTKQRPLLLFLEDFHAVDEGSLQILRHILRHMPNEPLLVVCAAQPGDWEKRPFWETAQSFDTAGYTNVPLEPLSLIDSRHLINELLGDLPQPPLRLIDLIMSSAAGNPQTIEEMVRYLISHNVLLTEKDRWRVQLSQLHKLRVPRTLQGLFGAKFGELSPDEQLLLQKAAVFGHTFPLTLLSTLTVGQTLSASKQQQALTKLQDGGHLLPIYTTVGKPTQYRFREATLQQVAYSSIRLVERALYHQQAAGLLAGGRSPQPTAEAAVIAEHYERAEQLETAAHWFRAAASYAERQRLPETAVATYQKAIQALPETAGAYQQQIEINHALGRLLRRQGKLSLAAAAYQQLAEDALLLGDAPSEIEARLRLCLIYAYRQQPQAVVEQATLAQETAEFRQQPLLSAKIRIPLAWGLLWLGKQQAAAQVLQTALQVGAEQQDHLTLALGHALLAQLSQQQQKATQAKKFLEKGLAFAESLNNSLITTLMLTHVGELNEATEQLENDQFLQGIRSSERYLAFLIWLRQGETAELGERFYEAEQAYESALTLAHQFDDSAAVAETLCRLGLFHLAGGYRARSPRAQEEAWQQAQRHLQLGQRLATETGDSQLLSKLLLANGRYHVETEHLAEARRNILAALDLLAKLSAEPLPVRQLQAEAWWLLGTFIAKLPPNKRPFKLGQQLYDPPHCFQNGLKIFSQIPLNTARDEKQIYLEWAKWEEQWGDEAEALPLRATAEKLS